MPGPGTELRLSSASYLAKRDALEKTLFGPVVFFESLCRPMALSVHTRGLEQKMSGHASMTVA